MTPDVLEGASQAYHRGYHDELAGRPWAEASFGTFTAHDYAEGREAARAEINYATLHAAELGGKGFQQGTQRSALTNSGYT